MYGCNSIGLSRTKLIISNQEMVVRYTKEGKLVTTCFGRNRIVQSGTIVLSMFTYVCPNASVQRVQK